MTQKEIILDKFKRNEIQAHEALALLKELNETEHRQPRNPPKFKVAEKSGWCSVYFDGLRRPCSLPSKLWEELLEHSDRFRKFLNENKHLFKNKGK